MQEMVDFFLFLYFNPFCVHLFFGYSRTAPIPFQVIYDC